MRLPIDIPIRRDHPLARLLCRGDVVALTLNANGRLEVERRDGSRVAADIEPETTVLRWLIVLRYRLEGRRNTLVVPRAATDPDGHRRLRVWLAWRAQLGDATSRDAV